MSPFCFYRNWDFIVICKAISFLFKFFDVFQAKMTLWLLLFSSLSIFPCSYSTNGIENGISIPLLVSHQFPLRSISWWFSHLSFKQNGVLIKLGSQHVCRWFCKMLYNFLLCFNFNGSRQENLNRLMRVVMTMVIIKWQWMKEIRAVVRMNNRMIQY